MSDAAAGTPAIEVKNLSHTFKQHRALVDIVYGAGWFVARFCWA